MKTKQITFKGGPLDETTTMLNEDVHSVVMLQEINGQQHIITATGDTHGNIVYNQSANDASVFEVQE